MVRTEGADKRGTARFLAYGVNGLVGGADGRGLRAHRPGVTGAEAGIAGGSAVLGQKLLEAVFGDQAVRTARRARHARPRAAGHATCSTAERRRYTDLLDSLEHRRRRRRTGCATPPGGSTTCASPPGWPRTLAHGTHEQ